MNRNRLAHGARRVSESRRSRAPRRALAALLLGACALPTAGAEPHAHTYSIVARDPATGQLGVAVQSHWFRVGALVPWAEAGVGAVATQSFVRVAYGPQGLARMAAGESAGEALDALLAADPERAVRQVAMVDAAGGVAAWTGDRCIAAAGHRTGDGYSVQANLMARDTVWDAMAAAYEGAKGELAERLLAALEAAEGEGGDIRGRQSAALLVVRAEPTGEPWRDRLVDLRVDDHPAPVGELRRLLSLHRAYQASGRGDEALAAGRTSEALLHYREGARLAPKVHELRYWQAVTLFTAGRVDDSLPIFREVFAAEPRWVEVTRRLPAAGLLPADPEQLEPIWRQVPEVPEGEETVLTVAGVLTAEGVECPALRADDGTLYTLAGRIGDAAPGERVVVEGRRPRFTHCGQGITLEVLSVRREPGDSPLEP